MTGEANFDGSKNITIVTTQANIAILTGTITLTNGRGSTNVNYPEGFNYNNCVVISIGAGRTSSNNYLEYGHVSSSCILGAYLKSSDISISAYPPESIGPSSTVPYKLILMKIN